MPFATKAWAICARVIMVSGLSPQSSSFVKEIPSAARFPASFHCGGHGWYAFFPAWRQGPDRQNLRKSPKMWISVPSKLLDTSIPGITSILRSRPFSNASGTPAVVSWSVRAKASNPAFFCQFHYLRGRKGTVGSIGMNVQVNKTHGKTSFVFKLFFLFFL